MQEEKQNLVVIILYPDNYSCDRKGILCRLYT